MTIVKGPNIENIDKLAVVKRIADRARAGKNVALLNRCIRRLAILEGRSIDDPLEAELWTAVHALEAARSEEAGKTVRLSRTRQMMKRRSASEILERWALDAKQTDGFVMLKERGMLDLAGEAIVLRHPDKFSEETLLAARKRLSGAGFDPSALEKKRPN